MIREIEAWWERVEKKVHTIRPRQARRVIVAVVGFTVLLLGLLMLALPGPALLVIPAGLAILGLEFAWAKKWLHAERQFARQAAERASAATSKRSSPPSENVQPPPYRTPN